MKLLILNGPNLNLLGTREREIYGEDNLDDILSGLKSRFPEIQIEHFQSNVEGELINALHEASGKGYAGIVFNPGGYTHTSVAIADALAAITVPAVEVHISNLYSREGFRQISLTAPHAIGVIQGMGVAVYALAILYFRDLYNAG